MLRPGGRFLLTEFALRGTPDDEELAAFTELWSSPSPTAFPTLLDEVVRTGFEVVQVQNITPNVALCAEVMCAMYAQRHAEIESRYGAATTARTDPLMEPFRRFSVDHLDYYLLLLRAPAR